MFLKRFGIAAIRGSSSRGWVGGLKGMVEAYRLGYDLIVFRMGPAGLVSKPSPAYSSLPEPQAPRCIRPRIVLRGIPASRAGIVSCSPFLLVESSTWWGHPISVPADATPEQMEQKRQELEERLCTITEQADAYFS